jgi:hypothetical protein
MYPPNILLGQALGHIDRYLLTPAVLQEELPC